MDPITLFSSINLASKLLPSANNSTVSLFSQKNARQNLPSGSISFNKILQAQELRGGPANSSASGDHISQFVLALPELHLQVNPAEWSSLSFEIEKSGNLTIVRPDQSREKVSLALESRSYLVELYQQTQKFNPPFFIGQEVLRLEVLPQVKGPSETAFGSRVLEWKAA
jgi:hypothetical protein